GYAVTSSAPSTPSTFPLIQRVPGNDSATIAPATSSGSVSRPPGFRRRASPSSISAIGIFRTAGVSVTPARIAFTATPFVPSSSASCRTCDSSAAFAADTARVQVLHPVDEAVRHHVERHLELSFRRLLRARVGDERLQRAECERIHDHAERLAVRQLARAIGDLRALLVVGGVDVEEVGGRTGRLDVGGDGLGERQRRLAVEVDANDPHAVPPERARRRGTKAARCAENDPPLALERAPCVHERRLLDACPPGNARLRSRLWVARATDR